MNSMITTPSAIIELAKKSWDAVIDLYKNSTPEVKEKIIKILAATGGFAMLLNFLKKL